MPRPHAAAIIEDAWYRQVAGAMRRRGWGTRVLTYTGYGSAERVRVLGRVLIVPPVRTRGGGEYASVRGWRAFASVPVGYAQVTVTVDEVQHDVVADRGGVIDTVLPAFGPGLVAVALFLIFLLLPIYWLVNMSFKTNQEIISGVTLWPANPTLDNYRTILTDPSWYRGYINSMIYVAMNTVISVAVALPAAYAFSRYRFLGDKHLFFWLLTNRMAPPAVFALPFFQLYSAFGLIDTHIAVALAHCLFNVPLAVWILEGFMSGVPKEIDETAYIDGYSFPRFFLTIFLPLIKAGVGVAAFFCFMFSWVELLIARTLTTTDLFNAATIGGASVPAAATGAVSWRSVAHSSARTLVAANGASMPSARSCGVSSGGSAATATRSYP